MILRKLVARVVSRKYGWFGNYTSWEEAEKASGGYSSREIIEKVKNAVLKVKNGEAAFERDSVLFYKADYAWNLLSGLLWVATQNGGKLCLMDFGGSLGSSYFRHKTFLDTLNKVSWNIVEQEDFYNIGRSQFQDHRLKFYRDINSCLEDNKIDAVLFGCVLPYIASPYELLEEILKRKFTYVLLDRMPFISGDEDRLTVQIVPPAIYAASYPAWFFSYTKFLKFISARYDVVAEYVCEDRANIKSEYRGLILKIKQ